MCRQLNCTEPDYDFEKNLTDADAYEKETAEFECEVNDEEAQVQWFREDKVSLLMSVFLVLINFKLFLVLDYNRMFLFAAVLKAIDINDPKYFCVQDGKKRRLRVTNINGRDEGIYKCKVQNKTTYAKLYVARKFKSFVYIERLISSVDTQHTIYQYEQSRNANSFLFT